MNKCIQPTCACEGSPPDDCCSAYCAARLRSGESEEDAPCECGHPPCESGADPDRPA